MYGTVKACARMTWHTDLMRMELDGTFSFTFTTTVECLRGSNLWVKQHTHFVPVYNCACAGNSMQVSCMCTASM